MINIPLYIQTIRLCLFQALAKDKLFPYIHIFAKGYGASGEPKRAYFLCFGICLAMTCIGKSHASQFNIQPFYYIIFNEFFERGVYYFADVSQPIEMLVIVRSVCLSA